MARWKTHRARDEYFNKSDINEQVKKNLRKTALYNKIRVVNPVCGRDWIVWKVFNGDLLVGTFCSSWEAEQFRLRLIENGGIVDGIY